jgi:hypothetical protein
MLIKNKNKKAMAFSRKAIKPKAMHKAKHKHFDECIGKIAHTNFRPWDLMDWVGP